MENDNYRVLFEDLGGKYHATDASDRSRWTKRIFVYFLSISAASICEKLKTLEENALFSFLLREDPGV